MSLGCACSMLPCGRYYYEPEGGYVGNPWVKFSYQYMYLYLFWIIQARYKYIYWYENLTHGLPTYPPSGS
jgi:hypothetical protein